MSKKAWTMDGISAIADIRDRGMRSIRGIIRLFRGIFA